jgi:mono/diheme cytochrome c family protein
MNKHTSTVIVFGLACMIGVVLAPSSRAEDKKIDFVKDIQPILATTCVKCHGADPAGKKPKSKFDLTTKATAMKGGETGGDIKPGKAEESLLYKTLLGPVGSGDDEIERMPHKKDPLSAEQIKIIKDWIDQGAQWPDDVKVTLQK